MLVERLRLAGHDERKATGPLYLEAADAIDRLVLERDAALASCAVLAGLCDVHAIDPKETDPHRQHIEQGFRIIEAAKDAAIDAARKK